MQMGPLQQIKKLYDQHAQALFHFLLNYTHSEADSLDLLQEVFLKISRRPELLQGIREERSFLIRLAANQAIDAMRRRETRDRNHQAIEMDQGSLFAPSDNPDVGQFRACLSKALRHLPPEQRAIVHLKLWEGLTFEQIATTLEIPINTTASRYRYGIDKMRELLRPLYEEIKF